MAFMKRNDTDSKPSSLSPSSAIRVSVPTEGKKDRKGKMGKKTTGRSRSRVWVTVLVDLILLIVIAGLVVGGVFAYRAIRELYAPVWETREVVFEVEMKGIDLDNLEYDKITAIKDRPLWSSDLADADLLGTVTDIQTFLIPDENGENTLTLHLTVEATAYYREGKGYRMGATMLLAGMKGTFMAYGLVADGMVISMHEKQEETVIEGEIPAEPDGGASDVTNPDAQG